jgi:hypothetical protein
MWVCWDFRLSLQRCEDDLGRPGWTVPMGGIGGTGTGVGSASGGDREFLLNNDVELLVLRSGPAGAGGGYECSLANSE